MEDIRFISGNKDETSVCDIIFYGEEDSDIHIQWVGGGQTVYLSELLTAILSIDKIRELVKFTLSNRQHLPRFYQKTTFILEKEFNDLYLFKYDYSTNKILSDDGSGEFFVYPERRKAILHFVKNKVDMLFHSTISISDLSELLLNIYNRCIDLTEVKLKASDIFEEGRLKSSTELKSNLNTDELSYRIYLCEKEINDDFDLFEV